jgi:hypothetical protein
MILMPIPLMRMSEQRGVSPDANMMAECKSNGDATDQETKQQKKG